MTKTNPISHFDIPTGPMEPADIDRVLSGVLRSPFHGHERHSGSEGRPSALTVVYIPSFLRMMRESASAMKTFTFEFPIFMGMTSLLEALPQLDQENEGSLVHAAIRDTDEHPDTDRESLKQEVHGLLEEAGTEDWDGEGALALDPETVVVAQKLIDHFPSHVVRPDVAATPHGEVDFDWIVSQNVMLTVSVCPSGEIAFAGLFHDARLNGREPWTGALPQFVGCCFERLRESQSR